MNINFVNDPTLRFERSDAQNKDLDRVNKRHYEPCSKYLEEKYNIPENRWEVIALLFVAY